MRKRKKAGIALVTIIFLILSASGVYAVDLGFDTYIDNNFVGTVKNYHQAEIATDKAGEILGGEISGKLELYLKFIKKGEYSNQQELVNNIMKVSINERLAFKEAISMLPSGSVNGVQKNMTLGSGVFDYPVTAEVSSSFGERWGKNHEGTDFAVQSGTEVLASDNGTVAFAGVMDGYGNIIILDHGNGYETYYAHLSEIKKAAGEVVNKGDVIAFSGNTGRTTGPHLHFEIRQGGEPQNPEKYLD